MLRATQNLLCTRGLAEGNLQRGCVLPEEGASPPSCHRGVCGLAGQGDPSTAGWRLDGDLWPGSWAVPAGSGAATALRVQEVGALALPGALRTFPQHLPATGRCAFSPDVAEGGDWRHLQRDGKVKPGLVTTAMRTGCEADQCTCGSRELGGSSCWPHHEAQVLSLCWELFSLSVCKALLSLQEPPDVTSAVKGLAPAGLSQTELVTSRRNAHSSPPSWDSIVQ